MSNEWFLFALLAPALFALVVIIDDNLVKDVYRSPYFGAIISGLFALVPIAGILFIPTSIPPLSIILLAILSGFLTVFYYLLYFKGLLVEAPSIVIALFSLSRIFVPVLAFVFLGEVLKVNQYLGFIIILICSLGLSVTSIKKFKFSNALLFIGFAAVLTAIIAIVDKYVYGVVDFWNGYIFYCVGMGLGALAIMFFFKEGRKFPSEFKKKFRKWIIAFAIVEAVGISAEFTLQYAISKGPVSLVKVIEGTQPLFMLVFAILLYPLFPKYFREATYRGKTKKFLLMILILLGLYLVNK